MSNIVIKCSKNGKPTVSSVAKFCASIRRGVFHVSELRKDILKIIPSANDNTLYRSVQNLVANGFLELTSNQHYRVKDV